MHQQIARTMSTPPAPLRPLRLALRAGELRVAGAHRLHRFFGAYILTSQGSLGAPWNDFAFLFHWRGLCERQGFQSFGVSHLRSKDLTHVRGTRPGREGTDVEHR